MKQAPFASTLMSSVQAAYEYFYKEEIKESMLFGLSGHAFVINITNGVGPCAPYLWDTSTFNELVRKNLGLNIFLNPNSLTVESSKDTKEKASSEIRGIIESDNLALLASLEYQVIYGLKEGMFQVTKPWDDVFSVTPDMKENSLEGMKDFMTYFRMEKHEKGNLKEGIVNSIRYAISLFENPSTSPDNAMGGKAYDYWLDKLNEENAVGHGNWWTSSVWAESRRQASAYMLDLKEYLSNHELLEELSKKYLESNVLLTQIANKETGYQEVKDLIGKLKKNELEIYSLLKTLV